MLSRKSVKYWIFTVVLTIMVTSSSCATVFDSDTSKVNSILRGAKTALDANDVSESFRLSRLAFYMSNRIDFTYGKAKSLILIAQIQSINGRKDSSILFFKKALNLFRKTNSEFDAGDALNKIGNVFEDSGNQDSAEFYFNESLRVRQIINDKIGVIALYNSLGKVYYYRSQYSKSLEYYFISLSLAEQIGDKPLQSATLNNIGGVFWSQGDYAKALEFFIKSLKIKEELNDIKSVASINNNIGMVYRKMGDINMALKYYDISLSKSKSINDSISISSALMGLGFIYHETGDFQKALDSFTKSAEIRRKETNRLGLADIYVCMGDLFKDMGDKDKALKNLEAAYNIYVKLDEPWGKAKSLIQIGEVYSELGLKQEALEKCSLGLDIAKGIRALEIIKDGYQILNIIYEQIGNTKQAYSTYKLFITYRDSITNLEKSKQILRLQLQSEFEKVLNMQKTDQDNQLDIAQLKSVKQTKIANIFILAFAMTLSVFIVFYINNRQKQKHNTLLGFQTLDMERQKSELTFQRDELQIQKDLVIHQRDKIMTMLTDLGESIDYARKIQQALLPSDKTLEKLLGEHFLFFQPRESVGGDFYWVAQKGKRTFFALADCTGHGVPGGFMSMLGVSLLNELVSRSECLSPAKMLWDLREMIIKALSQTGLDEDSQDGMDIGLCMYNSQNRNLVYAGANLSLFLVTSNLPKPNEKIIVHENIVEFKPDRMPVSYYLRMVEYNNHHIVISPGDCLYLSSDGYTDQFGGPNNKKFGYNTFKNLILSASTKPLDKQRDIFWNEFDKWKGEENQTDDVIVMGVKFA